VLLTDGKCLRKKPKFPIENPLKFPIRMHSVDIMNMGKETIQREVAIFVKCILDYSYYGTQLRRKCCSFDVWWQI